MVALRVSTLKPAAVVLHGLDPSKIDPVAKKIAEAKRSPHGTRTWKSTHLINTLKGLKE